MASSSSVRQARLALAARLRAVRVAAGLTGQQLAEAAGWHRTKVSKLEHAVTVPSAADVRTWCRVCQAEETAEDLVASLVAVDTMWTEWRRLERSGLRAAQEAVLPLWERTRRFRIYSPWLVPGPLQSEDYVRALLRGVQERRGVVDDVEDAVAARLAKQRVVLGGAARFAVVVEESALRTRIGGARVLAGQLRHLREVMRLASVSVGVIPFDADRSALRPVEMFFLFDDAQVNVEFVSGWLRVTTREEIALYAQAFTRLASLARYGAAARRMLDAAVTATRR